MSDYNGYAYVGEVHNQILDQISETINPTMSIDDIAGSAARVILDAFGTETLAQRVQLKSIICDYVKFPASYALLEKSRLSEFVKVLMAIVAPNPLETSASARTAHFISVTDKVRSLAANAEEVAFGLSYLAVYNSSTVYWQAVMENPSSNWHDFFPEGYGPDEANDVASEDAKGAILGGVGGAITGGVGGLITGAITGPGALVTGAAGFAGGLIGGLIGGAVTASLAKAIEPKKAEA